MAHVRVKTSFAARHRVYRVGEILPATDPVVAGNGAYFESLDDVVEQATAAPGEKRTTARKSAARKRGSAPADPEIEAEG